jgi:hypothetical protein
MTAFSQVDVLTRHAKEAGFLTGEADFRRAALADAVLGLQGIILTHKVGLLFYNHGQFQARIPLFII